MLVEQKRMYARIAADVKQQRDRQRWIESGKETRRGESIEDLFARMPTPSSYAGIPTGRRGSHQVCGSIREDNFAISEDGETWVSFHGRTEKGKGGDIIKLIALEQGYLTDEREPLRGEAFKQTIECCRERWG
ncbi:MAG: hypothetical protein RJR34_00040 [Candidatus Methanoculleus thermohydrogenotrophicum]|nr:hypothetical protein [Candidatus Methanoculleus thermohydrogenotrophicum]